MLSYSYFWDGDLPENNKWYLIVGYVFPMKNEGDEVLSVQGGIYDCTTGAKAAMVSKSFNWEGAATIGYLSCYHMYNTNTATRQWMYHPRVDVIDGNEPSVLSLIGNIKAEAVGARPSSWTPTAEDVGAITDAQAQAKVDLRLSAAEKTNLASNKTLGGALLYHTGNKPNANDVGAITDAQAQTKVDSRLSAAEKINLASNKTLDGQKQLYHTGNKPTATDVNARPNTWTPTAEDVGARADKWLPSPKDIGAETPEGAQDKVDAVAAEVTALTTRVSDIESDVQDLQVPSHG
ncbi:MAG: hypothetical protein PHW19_12300 [Salinivirgaceae bacterium]|nr:hypothetical protein [Salinivirgaceae bacterium]